MRPLTICLWFDDQAEEAAAYYASVFPDGEVTSGTTYDADSEASPVEKVTIVNFRANGVDFMALNGGPQDWRFNESVSLVVTADTQEEADRYWETLRTGGETQPCGWVKDRYGLSWQIVPDGLDAILSDPDPDRARRAMDAMFRMTRLDLAEMRAAADATDG